MKKFLLMLLGSLLLVARASAQTATVTPNPTTYSAAGGQITFTVALTFPTGASSASFSIKPPTNTWIYLSTAGAAAPQVVPNANDTTTPGDAQSVFGWAYSDLAVLGSGAASYTFTLSYPAGLTGAQSFVVAADYRLGSAGTTLFPITVAPLVVSAPIAPSFTTQPANVSVPAGQNATFTVAAVGPPAPTVKWQRSTDAGATYTDLANGAGFSGVTTTTLTVIAVTSTQDGNRFRAVATNGAAPDAVSNPATLSVSFAPQILTHPRTQTISTGVNIVLTVIANGAPAPTYQWRKGATNLTDGGRISGATTATLTIAASQVGDEGGYSVVVSNGIAPNATSNTATITLGPPGFRADHSLSGGYTPGGTISVENTIVYTGELSSLSWSVLLPAGWTYESGVNAGTPSVAPTLGDSSVLDWIWATAPASGSKFSYVIKAPTTAAGTQALAALVEYGVGETPLRIVATPDPLLVNQIFTHTADTNQNFKIEASELSRVIVLFNTRFDTGAGKVRTGAYKLQTGTVDGFASDTSRDPTAVVTLASYHAADTNRDGKIAASELSRVIVLFNTRFDTGSGKVRTGAYKAAVGITTVDGYTTDPTRSPSS